MRSYFLLTGFVFAASFGHTQQVEYVTPFVPYSITYNGSDDPNECWESVDVGMKIDVGGRILFFTLPAREFEQLKESLRDQQVTVIVIYYDEPTEGSFAHGMIQKIIHNNTVVYSAY